MLTRDKIIRALTLLGAELAKANQSGEILLTGGAAMCLVHSARDMTKDIDALYEPKEDINRLAKQIAESECLPENWLNDGVKGFVVEGAPIDDFIVLDGLKINVVAPDYLLSMKLISARYGETDAEDIKFLIKKMKIKTVDEAYAILMKYYPEKMILPKTMYVIHECLNGLNQNNDE